jgi:glycogen debranching enzyme
MSSEYSNQWERVRIKKQDDLPLNKSFWESRTLFSKRVLAAGGILILFGFFSLFGQPGHKYPQYKEIHDRLADGWNTWNTRSVLSHVLLPEGFAVNLAFKQHYWLEENYLKDALIGRSGKNVEEIRPGPHTYDGSFTRLDIRWEELKARVESAGAGEDLVILVTPDGPFKNKVKLIIESAMLWNREGCLSKAANSLKAKLPKRTVNVFCTADHVRDPYVETTTPYISVFLDRPVGISTGKPRSVAEIERIIEKQEKRLQRRAQKYGSLAVAYIAVQAGIAWNLIYEPKHDRVVSTVGRLWNREYGGYCLFGWDNFFLAYMTSLDSRDLAYANVIEHLRGKTEEGFIPNDNRGNGSKSFDRSQPPVGSIMVKEIYKRYPEKWFLEATFEDLLGWNRWWIKRRMNQGLLSYGSHVAKNPFNEPAVNSKRTAGYESGMDDSPMYSGVPFNKKKNTLELQDVGLNSLYIADCEALAEMAQVLGRKKEGKELKLRARQMKKKLAALWHNETGLYLNKRTDSGEFSMRLSPTLFYPLLAQVPDNKKAERMLKEHFFNPQEFAGEWILPSIARNDKDFQRQRYWKGSIWPPLNFLTYLSLRNYKGDLFKRAAKELAEKSLKLFITEWQRKGYVSENYSSITGTGDDSRLSSDPFHSWGALFGFISFIEKGYMGE